MDKYNELKEEFEANRNDESATKMAAYMRNLFALTGICLTDVMQTNIGNSIIL